ncbi:DNA polymerase III subunit delta' [Pontivivens ytuae]|uniref:DNA polymerase III subunit delta n=1 Tax=Pontivivens ytuae TaxID=2789856 RepID=A0A7S9LSQ9_9RHOB|nr:DNA polymerase III subunit delta' [Pontivivens ytuae]QPH54632.1 DNA polymerase III subunit delta' [Pontivivens ytuae]
MSDDALPEPDRVEGAPHPRETASLHGQHAAEDRFLDAAAGRLHHGWMLTGPRGVGKATLGWRIARFLVDGAEDRGTGLYVPPDSSTFRRIAALGEPRVHLTRRPWDEKAKRLRTVIGVEEVRSLKSFFTMSAADGGWRVAIVDAMDEMNVAGQNALLKVLEEPPERALILMVCHQPGRLLPTIRSRCRELRLGTLDAASLDSAMMDAGFPPEGNAAALAELSGGSAGEAIRMIADDGVAVYAALVKLLDGAPKMSRPAMIGLAETAAGRTAETRYDLMVRLVDRLLARLSRTGAMGETPVEVVPGEAAVLARLAPGLTAAQGWADLAETLAGRVGHARAVNLDPAQVMLDTFVQIDATARRVS